MTDEGEDDIPLFTYRHAPHPPPPPPQFVSEENEIECQKDPFALPASRRGRGKRRTEQHGWRDRDAKTYKTEGGRDGNREANAPFPVLVLSDDDEKSKGSVPSPAVLLKNDPILQQALVAAQERKKLFASLDEPVVFDGDEGVQQASHARKPSTPTVVESLENPDEWIHVKVRSHDEKITKFKIRKTDPLRKLVKVYCRRANVPEESVRIMFDGEFVDLATTPHALDMDNGDQIDIIAV